MWNNALKINYFLVAKLKKELPPKMALRNNYYTVVLTK